VVGLAPLLRTPARRSDNATRIFFRDDEAMGVPRSAEGCEADRVAQIIVTRADGSRSLGSGYRITTRGVLTAAHGAEAGDHFERSYGAQGICGER